MTYFRSDLKYKNPVAVDVPHRTNMMCLNESTFNPYKILITGIRKRIKSLSLNRYHNSVTAELQERLSNYVGTESEYIAYGNGADEMLYYLFTAVRDSVDSYAISLAPSYFDYKSYADAVGLGIKFIDLDQDFCFSPKKFIELSKDVNCRILILCNPNNPTGNLFRYEDILKVIRESKKLVLVDETYYEFADITFKKELQRFDNLIILRSFSKAFSLAGLRFGYMISQPANIAELKKVMTAFHLNLLTQALICEVLEHKTVFLDHNKEVIRLRNKLYNELQKLSDLSVKNTDTNFLIFNLKEKSADLFRFLRDSDIAIRDIGSHPLLKNYLRVTIGSEDQNNLFLQNIKKFLNNH